MKHILFPIAMMFCVGFVSAQDFIAMKDGRTIEDVKIISVTADEVTYQNGSSQSVIPSLEVDGVLYADGRYVTPPRPMISAESFEDIESTAQMLTDVDRDGYLICVADNKIYTGWDDLVLLGFVGKPIPPFYKDLNLKEKIVELQKYLYSLCILKEDEKTYKLYLKNHKDKKKLFKKASDKMSYEIALPASRAYKAKKDEGASSEEAVAIFVNTYIDAYNQSKNEQQ